MDFNKTLFRCSGLHHIMTGTLGLTDAQKKTLEDLDLKLQNGKELTVRQEGIYNDLIEKRDNPQLLEGTKTYLKNYRKQLKYHRRRDFKSKYIKKGLANEEEAITMLSEFTGEWFENNTERFNNDWITGEYDIYVGDDVNNIKHGLDTKCSWDLQSFKDWDDEISNVYYWQNQGYMMLSGAEKWTTVYCLTNAPIDQLKKDIYREGWEWEHNEIPKWKTLDILNQQTYDMDTFVKLMDLFDARPVRDDESDENLAALEIVDKFVDMPLEERIVFKTIERDEKAIEEIKVRVEMCRDYMNYLENRELPKLIL